MRQCTYKLSISQYAEREQALETFVELFASRGIVDVESLQCGSRDEFDDMVSTLETDFEMNVDSDTTVDANAELGERESAKELLSKWNLSRFEDDMERKGWNEPRRWRRLSKDDLRGIGFRGGHLLKWQKGMGSIHLKSSISIQQMDLLREICFELLDPLPLCLGL